MKSISTIGIALLLFSAIALGCASADQNVDEDESIVGTWALDAVNGTDLPATVQDPEFDDPEKRVVFTTGGLEFRPDSSWTLTFTANGGPVTFVGTYSVSDGTLLLDWTGATGPNTGFQNFLEGGASLATSWTVDVVVVDYSIFGELWFSFRFRRSLPTFFAVASPYLHRDSAYL